MKQVKILGLGNFGYAILKHLDRKNKGEYELTGYARRQELVDHLSLHRKHPLYPHATCFSKNVLITDNLTEFLKDTDYLVLAVSSSAVYEVLNNIKPFLTKRLTIINTTKALHQETGKRFSQITSEVLEGKKISYALITGGTLARDMVDGYPLGVNIASGDKKVLSELTKLFYDEKLAIYPTTDLVSVEYACAFKNIISLFAGIIQGIGMPVGSESYIVTRAIWDVEKLVVNELGGKTETFSLWNPCWGGDIWLSCVGKTRNKEFGYLLGKGHSLEETLKLMENKTVEGVSTVKMIHKITDLKKYPFLFLLNKFFRGQTTFSELEKLIKG
ncbi:MAG: NAD(P)-binding domain-containing protein [Candidatus Roizmanbacteria bacterium]|nr:MAG: NAD(P)-binding domain-containing protein [Candidatus Roizmanbacteria bacterium]